MRRLISFIISFALCALSLAALSESVSINLSAMTSDELMALRDEIDTELSANHGVSSSDERSIMNDIEDYLAEKYGIKSFNVSLKNLTVTNDWGLYKATATYSLRDSNKNKQSGDIYAEYAKTGRTPERTLLTVDGETLVSDTSKSNDSDTLTSGSSAISNLSYGTLVDVTVNEIDSIIVIKAKIAPSLTNKMTIDQNYYNIEYLVRNYDVDKYSELQYWAVADMTDGSEGKVISFDVSQELMLKLKNKELAANQLGDFVANLWILPSLR